MTRKLPAAAGTQGAIWLLFGADGRLMDAATVAPDGPKALVASLKKDPPTISLPEDNRARIPLRAQTFCSASGECTMMLDPPVRGLVRPVPPGGPAPGTDPGVFTMAASGPRSRAPEQGAEEDGEDGGAAHGPVSIAASPAMAWFSGAIATGSPCSRRVGA